MKVKTLLKQLFCSHMGYMELTGREEKRPMLFQVLPTLFLESKCTKCGAVVWRPAQQAWEMYWDGKIARATVEIADLYAKEGNFKMANEVLKTGKKHLTTKEGRPKR